MFTLRVGAITFCQFLILTKKSNIDCAQELVARYCLNQMIELLMKQKRANGFYYIFNAKF